METFIDTSHFSGTCFRAAIWIRVGATQGRGRRDRDRQRGETVKDIYVLPLVADVHQRMGLPPHSGRGPLPIGRVWRPTPGRSKSSAAHRWAIVA